MNPKLVENQAASYALAGLFLSLLITFVACDLKAVRREAQLRYEDHCSTPALRACPGRATLAIEGVRGHLTAAIK